MATILRTLIAVKEIKLYSSLTRFQEEQLDMDMGFLHPNFTLKLSFIHTVTKDKFKITTLNYYNLLRNMETVVSWFYDENMKDMFFLEDGILRFNYDYSNRYVTATSPDGEHIEIRPAVDYMDTDRGRESIMMYINSTDSQTVMTREQFEAIYTVLKNFSFQNEIMLLIYEHDRIMEKYKNQGVLENGSKKE